MKHIFLIYAFISLIILAVLSVLSYTAGSGYVYVLWHNIQIQTNLWFLTFAGVGISFLMHVAWYFLNRYIRREKRKLEQVVSFSTLHPFEQFGVLWLLDGEDEQEQVIQTIFDQSGLLKPIVQSRLLLKQLHYSEALKALEHSSPSAFELAEILRIEIYLAQQDSQQALTHLEFLNGHELSPWLNQLSESYKLSVQKLWGQFALQYPWQYLHSTQFGQLETATKQQWLIQLLGCYDQASFEDTELLQQKFLEIEPQLDQMPYETKVLWLKIITRLPELAQQQQQLVIQILNEKFDQDVFHLWFQQQLLRQNPDYEYLEQQIINLESKYMNIPVFCFAKWHIYIATQREYEADQLLSLYPNDILMNYLRIKSTLNGNDELIQQLNSIFEKDSNYIQFKI
ncbi:tetratricopeptide repeat protein [Acinetobacter guillouiae]|uniref:tetratricopeptide repeat protein n=1 Tax=Acinetobacter TaxID=469 RepID=UPI001FBA2F98|nr:tetratricopeptide repeat protein [Acinetobacter sp. NyZ410]UOH18830.1 tetratricopeptide repeat protein [Acinetobacter sp. NyZ410]